MAARPPNEVTIEDVPADRNLCRFREHSCGGCCWGGKVQRETIVKALRRQTKAAAAWGETTLPSRRDLLFHELRCRRWQDLLWAPFLWLPLAGSMLGDWLHGRLVCAFLIFEDAAETRVGCALHPARWQDEDIRTATAFRYLSGFVCGARTFFCPGAEAFHTATDKECGEFASRTEGLDFFAYSNLAPGYRSEASRRQLLAKVESNVESGAGNSP